MPIADLKHVPGRLPEGYVAVPIAPGKGAQGDLRVCVVARQGEDAAAGPLVLLRDRVDSRVYLGCMVDAGGQVHGWVEVWVQGVDGLAGTVGAARQGVNNAAIDERWLAQVRAMERLDRPLLVMTGWEKERPLPTFVDVASGEAVNLVDKESGDRWRLCEDDAVLEKAGLPRYSSSLHRYLYLKELGAESPLVPVTEGAPEGKGTRPLAEILGGRKLAPLNPGGGYVMVRAASPIAYEPFVDALGGAPWSGIAHGRGTVEVELSGRGASGLEGDAGVFLGQQGKWGRLLEALHLKLRALSDAVGAVQSMVQAMRRPLLNVSPESFRVRIGEPARGLPYLWTARVVLVDPGEAVPIGVQGADATFYVPASGAMGSSIYRPGVTLAATRGRGTLRIREIVAGGGKGGDELVLEATVATQEKIEPSRNDLVWVRANLASGPVDLYGRLESKAAMAAGELRFRTVPQKFAPEVARALKEAQGVQLPESPLEVSPVLSSPVDLYALAVLAVRTLVTDPGTTLAVALDEMLSLARQAAADYTEDVPLPRRIRALFERDPRWMASLGPQHLTNEGLSPEEALDVIPQDLWWETLAMVVRMFPGLGPDSVCADYGDARPDGLHRVFDRAVEDLDGLLRKSRSLIVIDWKFNREIHAVIRDYLTGVQGVKA